MAALKVGLFHARFGKAWQGTAGWSRRVTPLLCLVAFVLQPNRSHANVCAQDATSSCLNTRLRSVFAKRITGEWRKTVKSILKTGHLLMAAKKKLPHGEFEAMVNDDLPFGIRYAEYYMTIVKRPWLAKANTCSHLPASCRALSQLSRLSKRTFNSAIRDGRINADMTVEEALNIVNDEVQEQRMTSAETKALRDRWEYGPETKIVPVHDVTQPHEPRTPQQLRPLRRVAAENQAEAVADTVLQRIQLLLDSIVERFGSDVALIAERISEPLDEFVQKTTK
jgi:hypothetical protein